MIAILLAALAFLLLGLATDQHHRRRFGGAPEGARCRRMRVAGWAALVASAIPALAAQGPVFGPILWMGGAMAGAALAFLALNLLPAPLSRATTGPRRAAAPITPAAPSSALGVACAAPSRRAG